jgi:hypothetical protein
MLKQAGSGSGINTPGSDAMPAYAEVDPNHTATLTTFQGHRGCDERCGGPSSSDGSSSPAPYATTTLVGSSRQHLSGLVSMHIPSKRIIHIPHIQFKTRMRPCTRVMLLSSVKCHTHAVLSF